MQVVALQLQAASAPQGWPGAVQALVGATSARAAGVAKKNTAQQTHKIRMFMTSSEADLQLIVHVGWAAASFLQWRVICARCPLLAKLAID